MFSTFPLLSRIFGFVGDLKWKRILITQIVSESGLVNMTETSLKFQWLRLSACNAGDTGLIPGWGTEIPQATWCGGKKKLESSFPHSHFTHSSNDLLYAWHLSLRTVRKLEDCFFKSQFQFSKRSISAFENSYLICSHWQKRVLKWAFSSCWQQ